jgi:hypothetical protein
MAKLWRPKVQQGIAGHLAIRGSTAVKHIPARAARFRPMPAWVHPRTSRGLWRERHRRTLFPPSPRLPEQFQQVLSNLRVALLLRRAVRVSRATFALFTRLFAFFTLASNALYNRDYQTGMESLGELSSYRDFVLRNELGNGVAGSKWARDFR